MTQTQQDSTSEGSTPPISGTGPNEQDQSNYSKEHADENYHGQENSPSQGNYVARVDEMRSWMNEWERRVSVAATTETEDERTSTNPYDARESALLAHFPLWDGPLFAPIPSQNAELLDALDRINTSTRLVNWDGSTLRAFDPILDSSPTQLQVDKDGVIRELDAASDKPIEKIEDILLTLIGFTEDKLARQLVGPAVSAALHIPEAQ